MSFLFLHFEFLRYTAMVTIETLTVRKIANNINIEMMNINES